MRTAVQINSAEIIAGRSSVMSPEEHAGLRPRVGDAAERGKTEAARAL